MNEPDLSTYENTNVQGTYIGAGQHPCNTERIAVGLLAGLGLLTLITLVGLAMLVWIVCVLIFLIVIL